MVTGPVPGKNELAVFLDTLADAASEAIIPQTSANRRRMMVIDRDMQLERLAEFRAIANDPSRAREFLLSASMFTALEGAKRVH